MIINNKTKLIFWEYNKKWLIVLFFASSALILISSIIKVLTPPQIVFPPPEIAMINKDGSTSVFNNIIYSGQNHQLPKELRVAKFTSKSDFEYLVVNNLSTGFNLQLRQDVENAWSGEDYTMAKSVSENKITMVKKTPHSTSPSTFNQEGVFQVVNNFSREIFPDLPLSIVSDSISLISNIFEGDHDPKINYRDAVLVLVPLTYKIDNYPVFYQNQNKHPFLITIDRDYQIQKLEFNNFFLSFELGNKIPLIPIDQAVDNINNGIGSIVFAIDPEYRDVSKNEILSGNLTSVEVEYRADENIGLIYPFYRFSGQIINNNNTTLQAEIITPAVAISD